MYPVIARNCYIPGRDVLCILIGELTSKTTLLLFTLLSESKHQSANLPVIVNRIKWLQTIQGRSLVILQSKLRGWVININFIPILREWTTKCTFYAIVYWTMMIIVYLICMFLICHLSYIFSQILNQWSVVISVTIFWISQRIT